MALTFSRATTATYIDSAGLIQTAGINVLRSSHYTPGGIGPLTRLEPAATNLFTQSDTLDNTLPSTVWSGSATTFTADFATGPDGLLSASRITGTAGLHNWHGLVTVTALTQYTASWWAKNNGGAGASYSAFDVTGAADIVAPTDYLSQLSSLIWTRVKFTFTTPAACVSANVYVARNSVGALDALFFGAQLEAGAVATTYIPTTTAAVTRAADFLSLDFQATAEAMSGLLEAYEMGVSGIADRRILSISNSADAAPYLHVAEKLGALAATINTKMHNGTTSTISADNADVTYAETDHVEVRFLLNTDGTHGVALTLNNGIEGTARMATSPGALVNWSATARLYIGNYGSVIGKAMSVRGLGIAQAVQNRDTLRYLVEPLYNPAILPGTGALTVDGFAPNVSVTPTGAPTYFAGAGASANIGAVSPVWPAGHQAGDIGIMLVHTANEVINTIPAGWAELPDSPQGTGTAGIAGSLRIHMLWKRATSSAEPALSIGDSGDHNAARIFVFRNCIATGNPWHGTPDGDVDGTSQTSVTIPGLTTTVNNCLIAAFFAHAVDSATLQFGGAVNASLSALTLQDQSAFTSGTGGGYGVVTGVRASAGVVSPTTGSLSTASKQARYVIALRGAVIPAPQVAAPGTGAVTVTGFAPTVKTPRVVAPPLQTLIVTGFAPTVTALITSPTVRPDVGDLQATGFAPTVKTPVKTLPDVGALVVTGFPPTVVITSPAPPAPQLVQPGSGAVVITGFPPTILLNGVPIFGADPYAYFPGDGGFRGGKRYEEYANEEDRPKRRRKKKKQPPVVEIPIVEPPPLGFAPLSPLPPPMALPPFPTMPPGVRRVVRPPAAPPPLPYADVPYTPEQEAEELALYRSILESDDKDVSG